MTKYILHGGETSKSSEHNKAFYQEWVKDFQDNFVPTILLVYFAREEEEWAKLEQQDKERFANYTDNRKANFVVADSDPNTLRDQIKAVDVVYVRGGSSDDLIRALSPLKDEIRRLLEGKTYAGSSAGVMVLAHYAASTFSEWKKGLGILPINSFVHWKEGWRKELQSYRRNDNDNNYEYLLIPETEFVVRFY